jgi:hypothetical protein
MRWSGIALEQYSTPACLILRHEHLEHFVHVVRSGSCNYQVNTGGKTRKFVANPGTIFLLPQGTVDELVWNGPAAVAGMSPHHFAELFRQSKHTPPLRAVAKG